MSHRRPSTCSDRDVADFVATMPPRYRAGTDWATARTHARISAGRRRKPADVGVFPSSDGPALCVVAADAPGVFAAVCASFLAVGFDILRAEAYTRHLPTREEALDLFWVRRQARYDNAPVGSEDAAAIAITLVGLLDGRPRQPTGSDSRRRTPSSLDTTVRFHHSTSAPLTLEVETADRSGLLLAIADALFTEGVQIVGSRISTRGLRAHDRFELVEADGSVIEGKRLQHIELAVAMAIDQH